MILLLLINSKEVDRMTKSMIVGEKIDILFEVVVKANGKPYKGKEVSKYTGVPETTISNLRHNPTLNPTIASLQELCKFFGVSLAYFDCNTPEECRVFIAKSRNRNGFDGVADNPVLSEIT